MKDVLWHLMLLTLHSLAGKLQVLSTQASLLSEMSLPSGQLTFTEYEESRESGSSPRLVTIAGLFLSYRSLYGHP